MSAVVPLRAPPRRGGLPAERTPFFGREAELQAVEAALAGGTPLLTLTGPAGMGKSRLAQRLVAAPAEALPGGVWWCDATSARTPADLLATAAQTLGVTLSRRGLAEAAAQLGHAMAGRGAALLVLDNFEHLVPQACETVGLWLDLAPQARLLVTSRVRLGLEGETCFELPPLRPADAVALYDDRARRSRGDLTAPDRAAVEALVARLDHLPLAIELAAARAAVLSPQQLLAQMDRRLDLLHGARHGRHTSLAGAIACSWELLSGPERAALSQCAVFRGGLDPADAEAVLAPPAGAPPVLDLLEALRDKSLLRRDDAGRLTLSESVRDFAERELARAGGLAEAEARHVEHFRRLGAALAARVCGATGVEAVQRLARERDNLLAAQQRAAGRDTAAAAELGLALSHLLARQGPAALEADVVEQTVQAARAAGDEALLGEALRARALAHVRQGNAAEARRDIDEGLALARRRGAAGLEGALLVYSGRLRSFSGEIEAGRRELRAAIARLEARGERHLQAQALNVLGTVEETAGRLGESAALFEEALRLFRAEGDRRYQGSVLMNLGVVRSSEGRQEDARALFEEALELLEAAQDRSTAADVRVDLGSVLVLLWELDAAEEVLEQALSLERALGNRRFEGLALGNLGLAAFARGSLRVAHRRLLQAMQVFRACDERRFHAVVQPFFAAVEAALGRLDEARADFAAARAALEELGDPGNLATLEALEGFLELAAAREAARRLDLAGADACVAAARRRLARTTDEGVRSAELGLALRILERALAERAAAPAAPAPAPEEPPPDALVVGESADWFEPPGGARVDLSRRGALRLVLQALVEQRLLAPGTGLSPERVFEAGWPGERALPGAAASRVYTAIRTLRAWGLGDVLRRRDDGYLLDPAVRVLRSRA